LIRRLGVEAAWSLLHIWEFCAKTAGKSAGNLCNMTAELIEIAANWTGDGDWVKTAADVGFLDRVPECEFCGEQCYHVHNYTKHNPWAAGSDGRREKAQTAAKARWGKETKNQEVNAKKQKSENEHMLKNENPESSICPISISISDSISNSNSDSITNSPKNDSGSSEHMLAPIKLRGGRVDDSEKNNWISGQPITSVLDLESFASSQNWAVQLTSKDRGRVHAMIQAGEIQPHEIDEGLARMGTSTRKRPVSYWLSCVEAARKEFAEESSKTGAPPTKSQEEKIEEAKKRLFANGPICPEPQPEKTVSDYEPFA
jgi:hypothetical protein